MMICIEGVMLRRLWDVQTLLNPFGRDLQSSRV
jgi:hypothetical protein